MINRLLFIQVALVLIISAAAFYFQGMSGLIGGLYGGAVALLSTLILLRRITQAGRMTGAGSQHGMALLYFGAIQRYVFVLVALAIGLGVINLSAKPLLATFGIAQLAHFVPWLGDK
ncbi:MAG TPA: ATP synthase subunit I [Chromatiales bacterium]|nr:ATP synthase subunit I [Thiotrichales bacterium]HIP69697.1 ATP synthase subunit I [Chromatiales bacterium]